jgi:uncharacterized membrane protein (DUF106 family)
MIEFWFIILVGAVALYVVVADFILFTRKKARKVTDMTWDLLQDEFKKAVKDDNMHMMGRLLKHNNKKHHVQP